MKAMGNEQSIVNGTREKKKETSLAATMVRWC
jgi:hypothetical protein